MNKIEDLVSVVIPVHNGARFITKTVRKILRQSYKNIEVLLVENNSSDNSLEICMKLANNDKRVRVLSSSIKGTSLARKKGVEESKGKYIVFSDQDDTYISNDSIEKMYQAIKEDRVQIVQFGYYKKYMPALIKEVRLTQNNIVLTGAELWENQIKGILGISGSVFSQQVWNKIYQADLLKKAVEVIDVPLYFAEDSYLNICAFANELLTQASSRSESYYIWNVGTGFSGQNESSGEALLRDYAVVKPRAIELLQKNSTTEEVIYCYHLETLYCYRSVIFGLFRARKREEEIKEKIAEFEKCEFIQMAKEYARQMPEDKLWPELIFMSSNYSVNDYYIWCMDHYNDTNQLSLFLNQLLNKIKRIVK